MNFEFDVAGGHLSIYDLKCKTLILSLFICYVRAFKVCVHFLGHSVDFLQSKHESPVRSYILLSTSCLRIVVAQSDRPSPKRLHYGHGLNKRGSTPTKAVTFPFDTD
jgi:hypothetical protein